MSRIPNRLLEHNVIVNRIQDIGSPMGAEYDEPVTRKAIVVDGTKRVVDQREGSETKGQEIVSSARILVQPEHHVPAGSIVTVWPGTPMERDGVVVATAYGVHSIAPGSAQFWIV